MKYVEFDMPFGMLMRNMHRWAAHGMVIAVWLHMFRVFMTGSYKPPREFNWVVRVILLVLTLLLSFTGYLLPWDQLSIWAVTVGSNMARATPLLGHGGPFHEVLGVNPVYDARAFIFGGAEIGPHTLLRFYILHCIFFPLIASIFMAVHFWRIRPDGMSGPPLAGGGGGGWGGVFLGFCPREFVRGVGGALAVCLCLSSFSGRRA